MSTKDQVAPLRLQSCLDRLGVEPTELLEISKNRNVFHVLLRLLPPDTPTRKRGHANE